MTIERNIQFNSTRGANRMMNSFAGERASQDFYLTGYEGIFVEANRVQLCEYVMSSVVSIGSDLLLVVDSESFDAWESLCYGLGINVTLVDANAVSAQDIEAVLSDNHEISHIMTIGVSDRNLLVELGGIAKLFHRSFVVECVNDDHVRLADFETMNIDYLLSTNDNDDMALVVARRSKLVQTEGNARRPSQDIYAMWQNSVAFRSSSLTPMYL